MSDNNLSAIRAALKGGNLSWSDVITTHKDLLTNYEIALIEERHSGGPRDNSAGTKDKDVSLGDTATVNRKSEPTGPTKEGPIVDLGKPAEKGPDGKPKSDLFMTDQEANYVEAARKVRDSGKKYDIADWAADGFLAASLGYRSSKIENQFGRISYHYTPAGIVGDLLNEALTKNDPEFFQYANFYAEQQRKPDPILSDKRELVERHMNDEEFSELKRLRAIDDDNQRSASLGLGTSNYAPLADSYIENLRAHGIYAPGEDLPSQARDLAVQRQFEASRTVREIGYAAKSPIVYLGSGMSKFVGDILEVAGLNKSGWMPTTAADRARWAAQDLQRMYAKYDITHGDLAHHEKTKAVADLQKSSFKEAISEAPKHALNAFGMSVPFMGKGYVGTFLAAKLLGTGVVGTAAFELSDITESPSKHRRLKDYEVPEELIEAHKKYSLVMDYLGRKNKFTKMMPSVDDVLAGAPSDIDWYNKLSEEISTGIEKSMTKVERHINAMSRMTEPSAEFRKKQEEGNHTALAMESVGASLQEIQLQSGVAIGHLALHAAADKIMGRFGNTPINLHIPAGIIGMLGNAATSMASREAEFYSEFAEMTTARVDKLLSDAGRTPLSELSNEELLSIVDINNLGSTAESGVALDIYKRAAQEMQEFGTLNDETRRNLLSGVKSGLLKTQDEHINQAVADTYYGSRDAGAQFMGLIFPDMMEFYVAALPFLIGKNALNFGQSTLSKELKKEMLPTYGKREASGIYRTLNDDTMYASIMESADDIAKYTMAMKPAKKTLDAIEKASKAMSKSLPGRAAKTVIRYGSRFAASRGLSTLQEEHLEETPQFIVNARYVEGKLKDNNTTISALTDVYSAAISGIKDFIGIETGDPLFDNNYELEEMRKITRVSTFLLGTTHVFLAPYTYNDLYNKAKTRAARNFVDGQVIAKMSEEARINKADTYVGSMTRGKFNRVIEYLEELKKTPPDGITAEEIDHEIRMAKKAYEVANSKGVRRYAKKAGGIGSQDHKQLVGLILAHENRRVEAKEYADVHEEAYEAEFNKLRSDKRFEGVLDDINSHILGANPDAIPMNEFEMFRLFSLLEHLESLDAVSFHDNFGSEFSRNRHAIMNMGKNAMSKAYMAELARLIEGRNIVDGDTFNSIASGKLGLLDAVDAIRTQMPFIPSLNTSKDNLIRSIAARIGASYESLMAKKLMGITQDNKFSDETSHNLFADKHLDAYRSRVKAESEYQEFLEQLDKLKRAERRRAKTTTEAPVQAEFSEDPIGTPVEEQATQQEAATEPSEATETSNEAVQPEQEESAATGQQEASTETSQGNLEVAPEIDESEIDRLIAEGDAAMDNGSNVQPEAAQDEEESTAPEESPLNLTDEDVEFLNAMESMDSGLFYSIIDSHPSSIANDPGNRFDKLSHTLFYGSNRKEIRDAINKFLMDKNSLSGNVSVYIEVKRIGDEDWARIRGAEKHIKFSADNSASWDNAVINITIKKDGKYYKFMLSMPNVAENSFVMMPDGSRVNKFSQSEIAALREFRGRVISEFAKMNAQNAVSPGSSVLKAVGGIFKGKPKIGTNRDSRGNAILRPLYKIAGMIEGFDGDFSKVGLNNLRLAFGKGVRGSNTVVSSGRSYGSVREQNSGSMFVVRENPVTGSQDLIKIDKLRAKDSRGMADFVFKLAVELRASGNTYIDINDKGEISTLAPGQASSTGLTPLSILSHMMNFGQHTKLSDSDRARLPHLASKQFYSDGQFLYYGDHSINISNPEMVTAEQKRHFIEYINNNMHWAIHSTMLWNQNGNDNRVRDIFPGLAADIDEDGRSVKFYEDFTITKEDLDLTWTAWLAKNNKLVSDAIDGIYEAPFLFINDVVADNGASAEVVDSNQGAPVAPEIEVKEQSSETSPAGETAQDQEKKGPTVNDFLDDFSGPNRQAPDVYEINEAEILREAEWLSSMISRLGFDINVLEDLIETSGGKAMGKVHPYALYLAKKAEKGTGYHEGFHAVSLFGIPRKRRMKVYNDVRETVPEMRNATNNQIEEYLAEQYRLHRLGLETDKLPTSARTMLRRINNITNIFSKTTKGERERLFRDIDLGIFRGKESGLDSRAVEENEKSFDSRYGQDAAYKRVSELGMESIHSATRFYEIVDGLSYYLMKINGVEGVDDLSNINMGRLYDFVSASAETMTGESASIWSDIRDNFYTIFAPEISKRLSRIGVEQDLSNAKINEESEISRETQVHDAASYELSRSNSISAGIKFFIATIPDSKMVNGNPVPSLDPVTKMFKFVPFSLAWNRLTTDLHKEHSPSVMMRKIQHLASNSPDGFYSFLLRKLSSVDDDVITKFWSSMYSHKHDFVNVSFSEVAGELGVSNSIFIENSHIDRKTRIIPMMWGERMLFASQLFDHTSHGEVFDKSAASLLSEDYKALSKDAMSIRDDRANPNRNEILNQYLDRFIEMLNRFGIEVDIDSINHMIASSYDSMDRADAIASIIIDTESNNKPAFIFTNILAQLIQNNGKLGRYKKGKPTQTIFTNEKSVEALASAYASTHQSNQEVIVAGADGNNYYAISERNYIIDVLDRLKNSSKSHFKGSLLDKMLSVVYNANSIVLNQLKNGDSDLVSLKTFVKMYDRDSSDKGRDYKNISKLEDYVMKMAANLKGNTLALPTLADKSTYFFLSGINVPNYIRRGNGITYRRVGNKEYITFPSSTLAIMDGYFMDEFNAIKSAWAAYQEADGNKNLLQEVYHYGGQNSRTGKPWMFGHGNGLRFRHFDMITIARNVDGRTVKESVNLNDLAESLMESMGEVEGMDAFIKFVEDNYTSNKRGVRMNDMNNTLSDALRAEISWALDAGIIRRSEASGGLENIALDKALISSVAESYGMEIDVPGLAGHAATLNLMANNMVNGIISTVEFEKVISKDPAYYKNSDDKIKRFSSLVSTGRVLRTDFPQNDKWGLHGKKSFTIAHVNDNIVISEEVEAIRTSVFASELFDLVHQSTGKFDYSIISGVKSGEEAALIALKEKYPDQYAIAEKYASEVSKDYETVDETDGSAWISPSMFRSIMIRLGRWSDYHQSMFEMVEGEDTSWMSDDNKYSEAVRFMMYPLKMVHFGDDFVGDLNVPRLNKMAMFTVFRPIATGDLKAMYDRMNTQDPTMRPVEMITVAQASKVGLNNPISLYEDRANTKLGDLSKLDVFEQEFVNLRHQLETEPHEGESTILRTQVQKVSMSNIIKGKNYSNISIGGKDSVTGEDLINEWKNAISELSNRGKRRVFDKLGIRPDEDGNYHVNTSKLLKFLKGEAKKSNMPSGVIDMFEKFQLEGRVSVPLQAMLDDSWIDSKITSFVLKNTLDIDTPGAMLVQMSVFGIKSTSASIDTEMAINGGKRLNFLNPDGSMDALVSIKVLRDIMPENIRKQSFKKQRDWLILHNIIGENAEAVGMGYRIPTQGTASVSKLRISDVMPDTIGDTIILPTEFTKLTGSDFDIDKLFFARYSFSKNNAGRFTKTEMNDSYGDAKWIRNSESAIKNRLLDVMLAAISDPTSMNETRISIDKITTKLKKEILADIDNLSLFEKKQETFAFSRPSYQADKKSEFMMSKSGIGPIALHNSNHPMTQMTNLSFIDAPILQRHGMTSLAKVKGRDGVRILDWLSALINAHVDAVKDPYITRLGVNAHTYKLLGLLIRTGVGEASFYYLSQPIMREVYKRLDAASGKYGVDLLASNNFEVVALRVLDEFKEKARALAVTESMINDLDAIEDIDDAGHKILEGGGRVFDISTLKAGLSEQSNPDFNWYYDQIMALETALALAPFYNGLSNLVKYSQVDTKKAGTSFIEQRLFGRHMEKIKAAGRSRKSVFANVEQYFSNTFINTLANNTINLISEISNGLLFRTTKSVIKAADAIAATTNNSEDIDAIQSIFKAIDTKIKSEFFRGYVASNGIDVGGLFVGDNTLAKRLFDIKSEIAPGGLYEHLAGNEFLMSLSTRIKDPGQSAQPSHIVPVDKSINDPGVIDAIQSYFSDLFYSEDKVLSDFARDFLVYQFYSTGDNFAINTVKLPEDIRESIGLYNYVASELQKLASHEENIMTAEDMDDLFRNRWHDNNLVPRRSLVYGHGFGEDGLYNKLSPHVMSRANQLIGGTNYPVIFTDMGARNIGSRFGVTMFNPYVKISVNTQDFGRVDVLYELIGVSRVGERLRPVYGAVNKLGSKESGMSVFEHGANISAFSVNNLPKNMSGVQIDVDAWKKSVARDVRDFALVGLNEYTPTNKYAYSFVLSNYTGQHDESLSLSEEADSRIDSFVDFAIESSDYGISNIERYLSSEGSEQGMIDAYIVRFAETLLSRMDDFTAAAIMNGTVADISDVEALESKMREYLSQYTESIAPAAEANESSYANASDHPINQYPLTQEAVNTTTSTETINIYAGTGENAELSNFAIRPFRLTVFGNEIEFQSVEQYYQYNKWGYVAEELGKNENTAEKILETTNGKKLRELGNEFEVFDKNKWDSDAYEIMKLGIRESFLQNPEDANILLSTGNAILTHTQDTSRWREDFPKIMMEIREELRSVGAQKAEDVAELFESNPELANAIYEALGFDKESNLSEKNIFTVEPIQSVDKKAKSKAKISTQFIGFAEGIEGSSTALYAKQISEQSSNKSNISINKTKWTKDSPKENPNTAYVFTENINSIGSSRVGGGSAVIRNNPNAVGIVTKKYYVYSEDRATSNIKGGWNQDFEDTDADFELFKKVNLEQFTKLDKYNSIIFPDSFANSLASIPNRFALWLQNELQTRYGLITELNSKGTGLISKSINATQSNIVNSGNYSSNDVIFVSIGGKRGDEATRKTQQDRTIREAIKALDAGATLITDNAAYVDSNSYNEGERRLAENLKAKGYNYSEATVDGDLLGVWSKSGNQITPQQKQQAQQLYSQHLDTIFADSKVKDIVYHGSPNYFEKFDKSKLGNYTRAASAKEGIFFGSSVDVAKSYLDKRGQTLNLNELIKNKYGEEISNKISKGFNYVTSGLAEKVLGYKPERVIPINEYDDIYGIQLKDGTILYDSGKYDGSDKGAIFLQQFIKRQNELKSSYDDNYGGYIDKNRNITDEPFESLFIRPFIISISNPLITSDEGRTYREESYFERIKRAKEENKDGVVIQNTYDSKFQTKPENIYVVFEPEQIHMLGGKQDIDRFKEFVNKPIFDKELAQKIQDKLQKLYPEIKLNITNNPIWEQGDNIFNQNIEDEINNFELFEDRDKLCPTGICNYTAEASTQHLQKIGLNPYPSNYNGSQLPVKVKSPIGDFNIEHYVSAVAINNAIYIYDMPQNEFISNEFFGKNSDVKVKESYKPRLIPLTIDGIKSNYNISTQEAGNFIHSIINTRGWEGAGSAPSFRKYIENNIKNPQEYINLLESQIEDSGYEFKQWDVEEYEQEYNNKRQQKKLNKISKKEEQKVINYYENKLKLKTKEYLPKKTDSFSLKTLINSVLGRGFEKNIDNTSFEAALQSLDTYLKSEKFVEDLLNKVINVEKNLITINKSIDEVYMLARLFSSFTKNVKVYGIEEAIKKYDSKQQYTIRTLLPSNVLDKYKSKEQAALLLQKYWGNKDNIVKQLNIYGIKTFTDLITNKFKVYSVFNKYQTVLNFLKSTDFDSSYLYQAISNEAIRRYSYFDKIGNTQFQKDEFSRIIGQANIKAMTVLVDAINQKQDTLPHEYAHHYIAWYRNTPIVQEAIKKWGSEEALVQSIGEQVVKQKGEAYDWWNKFVKWIMSQFNSLSKLQKEELTQILTDAFLTRQDLGSKQDIDGFNDFVKSNKSPKPDVIETSTERTTRAFQWYGSTYFFEFENGVVVDGRYMDGKGTTKQFGKKTKASDVYNRMVNSGEFQEVLNTDESIATADTRSNADINILGVDIDLSKIGIPFKLNAGQQSALERVSAWLMSDSTEPFVILGAAGTGKTSILRVVVEAIKAHNKANPGRVMRIAAASPTNTQKKVLSTLTGTTASTVHSMLGMKKSTDLDDFTLGQEDKFVDPSSMNIPRNGVIFIDEASMLKDDLVDFIIEKAGLKNTKVLFMGDRKQLEPVKNIDPATGKNKPSKALNTGNISELTEVMRIQGDNKLLQIVTWASQVMDPQNSNRDVVRRTMFDEAGGAVFLSESMTEDLIRHSVEQFFSTESYARDPHYAKWMSYTNKNVDDINEAIRSYLGYSRVLENGEHIVGNMAIEETISNGDYYTVTSISDEVRMIDSFMAPGVKIPIYDVELSNPNEQQQASVYVKVLASNDPMLLEEISNAIVAKQAEIASIESPQERRKEFGKFYKALNEEFLTLTPLITTKDGRKVEVKKNALSYYYAITTHKSQGKEFTNAFVNDTNLRLKVRGTTPANNPEAYGEYKQLFYVASSRAKENLFVVTSGTRWNETSPGQWTSSAQGEFDTIPTEMGQPDAFNKIDELGNQSDKC